jgi:hypothetical protein
MAVHDLYSIVHARFLVMTIPAEGMHRTPVHALPAGIMGEMKTVGAMFPVGVLTYRQPDPGNDRADADSFADRGDQSVTGHGCHLYKQPSWDTRKLLNNPYKLPTAGAYTKCVQKEK